MKPNVIRYHLCGLVWTVMHGTLMRAVAIISWCDDWLWLSMKNGETFVETMDRDRA